RAVRTAGLATAIVTASANGAAVVEAAGLSEEFDARIDGVVAAERSLPGKPAPDTFLAGAQELGVDPAEAVVIEDAISGVQAGRAGNFGYVIGVNRLDHAQALADAGANVVVDDLADLLAAQNPTPENPSAPAPEPAAPTAAPSGTTPTDTLTGRERGQGQDKNRRGTGTASTATPAKPVTPPRTAPTGRATRETPGRVPVPVCPCRNWPPANPCSRWRTGTSACAAASKRANRGWCRAPTSTASMSSGPCRMPSPGTGSPNRARPW